MTYRYLLYELVIETSFPCRFFPVAPPGVLTDIVVEEGLVPRKLQAAAESDNHSWDASPGRFLLRAGRRAGRFLVVDGKFIILERNPGAEDDVLAAYLLTWVMVALLRQRGCLVLHANMVVTATGAVAIAGESGAGKTSTLAELVKRGCFMVADDVAVLRFDAEGRVIALPGLPKLNLCEDVAIRMGHDIQSLPRNPLRKIKVMAPVDDASMVKTPVLLHAIYLIGSDDESDLQVQQLSGNPKFTALQECVYGPMLPGEHPGLFSIFTAVCDQVKIYRISRPKSRWSLNEVVEAIING